MLGGGTNPRSLTGFSSQSRGYFPPPMTPTLFLALLKGSALKNPGRFKVLGYFWIELVPILKTFRLPHSGKGSFPARGRGASLYGE